MLYQVFITQDGSPTLIWPGPEGAAEKMHHSAGALSESFYIYHQALRETVQRSWPMRVLSLGLGLGYNELIAIGEAHASGATDWQVWSFEASLELRRNFSAWLAGGNVNGSLHTAFDQVLAGVAGRFALRPEDLKTLARTAASGGKLELRGAFPAESANLTGCTCVFYDAFSKKLSPELWIEDQLTSHLERITAANCVLSTYASTGVLNRALKRLGFRLLEKKGFSGKRESTLAIREEIR
jgi:hypothetical protein